MNFKDIFQKGKSVLVITEKVPDLASILCCDVLVNVLNKEGLKPNWYIDETKLPFSQRRILPKDKSFLITSFNSKDYYTDIEDEEVLGVKVERIENKTRLVFNTKEGVIANKTFSLNLLKLDYDLILVFTSNKYGKIIKSNAIKDILEINKNVFYLQENLNDSISLKVCEMLFQSEIAFDSQEATVLLSGILWEVFDKNNFRFYEIVNSLIFKYKANFEKASSVVNFSFTQTTSSWRDNVLKNLKFNNKIKYSIVKNNDLKISALTNLSNEQKFPFGNNDKGDSLIISVLKNLTVVFAKGKIIEQLLNIEVRNFNLNSGVLTLVTELTEAAILKLVGLDVNIIKEDILDSDDVILDILQGDILEEEGIKENEDEKKKDEKQKPKIKEEKGSIENSKVNVVEKSEKRSTSVLSKQEPKKISVVNSSVAQKKKTFDPLPAANW